jgi:hypothetical protein
VNTNSTRHRTAQILLDTGPVYGYSITMAMRIRDNPLMPARRLATFSLPLETLERLRGNVPAGRRSQFVTDLLDAALVEKPRGKGRDLVETEGEPDE